jgi:hypothetical protein
MKRESAKQETEERPIRATMRAKIFLPSKGWMLIVIIVVMIYIAVAVPGDLQVPPPGDL